MSTPGYNGILPFPQPIMPGTSPYSPASYGRRAARQRDTQSPEKDSMDDLFMKLQDWFNEGKDRSYRWRQEAEASFDMVAGWHWDDEDIAILNQDNRPSVTFNRIGRNIDLITGQEVNNREEIAFLPREQGDVTKSEVLGASIEYVDDETDAVDERSDAFRDCCICGLGWTQTTMNYIDWSDGMPDEKRRDPLEMYHDPHAHQRNLKNTRWRARAITLPTREASRKFPHVSIAMLSAHWAQIKDDPSNPSDPDKQSYNYDDAPTIGRPPLLNRVTIIEMEWYEVENYAIVEDLLSGSPQG